MEKRLFHTIDGLRGLAAAAVVLLHMGMIFPHAWYPPGAYLAVDLFFGLSGFVLAEAYAARLEAGLPISAFLRERVLRLWPLYTLGLSIGAAATTVKVLCHHAPVSALFSFPLALVYFPWSGSQGELYPLNLPAWSLFYELLVNTLMAATWRRLSNQALAGLIGCCALGLVAAAWITGSLNAGFTWGGAPIAVARVGFSFFLGILLWRARLRPIGFSAWVPMTILVVGLVADMAPVPHGAADLLAVFLLFPLIIWLSGSVQPSGPSLPVFKALGAASYAVYTVHEPILQCIASVINKGFGISLATIPLWDCVAMLIGLFLLSLRLNALDLTVRHYLRRLVRPLPPSGSILAAPSYRPSSDRPG